MIFIISCDNLYGNPDVLHIESVTVFRKHIIVYVDGTQVKCTSGDKSYLETDKRPDKGAQIRLHQQHCLVVYYTVSVLLRMSIRYGCLLYTSRCV